MHKGPPAIMSAYFEKIERTSSSQANIGSTLAELLPNLDSTIVGRMPVLARLRDLRVRAGLTQGELADRAKVSRSTVNRLEGGDPNVRPTTLRRLARALHKKPEELID